MAVPVERLGVIQVIVLALAKVPATLFIVAPCVKFTKISPVSTNDPVMLTAISPVFTPLAGNIDETVGAATYNCYTMKPLW